MAQVVFLKNFKSIGKCQSSLLSLPMALFEEEATMSEIIPPTPKGEFCKSLKL
jgi:hypothetical protein